MIEGLTNTCLIIINLFNLVLFYVDNIAGMCIIVGGAVISYLWILVQYAFGPDVLYDFYNLCVVIYKCIKLNDTSLLFQFLTDTIKCRVRSTISVNDIVEKCYSIILNNNFIFNRRCFNINISPVSSYPNVFCYLSY